MSNQVTYRGVKYSTNAVKKVAVEFVSLQYRGKTYSKKVEVVS